MHRTAARCRLAVQCGLLVAAGLLSLATSPPRPRPTHAPTYMSWEAFRRSARVLPPRPIRERGKIYKFRGYLLMSEPNEGVHVFDNANPRHPVAKAFIEAPGTVDIAAKGRYLYIDSFVDLLVFELTPRPFGLRLVRRIQDVFPYNPHQVMPTDDTGRPMRIHGQRADKTKGVVIGWKLIPVRRKK